MEEEAEDPSSGATPLSAVDLMSALAAVVESEPGELPDQAVADGLVQMIDLSGRLDAAMARFAGVFDARALGASDGARTTAGWLAARTEVSRKVAAGLVNTGRNLRHCGHVEKAALEGRLGRGKVAKLLEARKDIEEVFEACEQDLVAEIEPMTVNGASRFIDRWRLSVLELLHIDGPEPATDPGRNELRLDRSIGGRWLLSGDLDALGGEALANALADWVDRGVKAGVLDPADPRGRPGLNADALLSLVGIGADNESGSYQPRTRFNVTWDADDLLGKDIARLADLDRRRCNTTTGGTLAFDRASELMCDAEVVDLLVRFGYDQTRNILGVTHTRRYPTDHERLALNERDGGCVFPGCHAPVHWCHAHHIVPYEIGQVTQVDDLVLLCGHHHRAIHGTFRLARDHHTGQITVTRPDGTVIRTEADGQSGRSSPGPARQGTKLPLAPPPGQPSEESRPLVVGLGETDRPERDPWANLFHGRSRKWQ